MLRRGTTLLVFYALQAPAVLVNAILVLLLGISYCFYSDTKCALWSNLVPRLHASEPCGANCGFISHACKKLLALPQIRSNIEEKAYSFLCMCKRMEYLFFFESLWLILAVRWRGEGEEAFFSLSRSCWSYIANCWQILGTANNRFFLNPRWMSRYYWKLLLFSPER